LKGTANVPFFIINMSGITSLPDITALAEKTVSAFEGIFLVQVKVKPTNNIKVFVDGDSGVTIETCVKINRSLYKTIEELGWYPEGDFSLEVSSPGVDEPLKLYRQYKKNIGRTVALTLSNEDKLTGKLTAANEEGIVIDYTEGKGKKAIAHSRVLAFEEIKQAVVQITF
jgi:ribosome maturation factor RimP